MGRLHVRKGMFRLVLGHGRAEDSPVVGRLTLKMETRGTNLSLPGLFFHICNQWSHFSPGWVEDRRLREATNEIPSTWKEIGNRGSYINHVPSLTVEISREGKNCSHIMIRITEDAGPTVNVRLLQRKCLSCPTNLRTSTRMHLVTRPHFFLSAIENDSFNFLSGHLPSEECGRESGTTFQYLIKRVKKLKQGLSCN